jgi:hypothetical protein
MSPRREGAVNVVDASVKNPRRRMTPPRKSSTTIAMADLIFIALLIAFFALCVVYVQWCDRIIGPDEFTAEGGDEPAPAHTYVAVDVSRHDDASVTTVTS